MSFIEFPLIPAYIISLLALINVIILFIWFLRTRSWTSVALILPLLYLILIYTFIDNLDLAEAQKYGRWGFAILLVSLAFINAVYAKIPGGGHNNGN